MAIYYNTSIVRNGLVLHYDPANTKSYNYRENLLAYSQNFTVSPWGSWSGAAITTGYADPAGGNTATLLTDNTSTGDQNQIEQNISIVPSATTEYTLSLYAKQGSATDFSLYNFFLGAGTRGSVLGYTFATDTISVGGADGGGITPYNYGRQLLGGGWVRVYYTIKDSTLGTNSTLLYRIYPSNRNAGTTGSTYVWGAQVQARPFLGDYVATTSAAITPITPYTDLSGQGNTAVTTGTVYDSSNMGSLVCTNNGTVARTTTSTDSLNLITSFSLNVWVKPTGTGFTTGQYYYVVAKNISGGYSDHQYAIEIPPGQNIELQIAGYTLVSPVVAWTTGTWYNISCTYDGSTATTYLNGEFLINGGYTGGTAFRPYLRISGRSSTTDGTGLAYPFPGNISAVQIYNRCISANEVKQNFQALRDRFGV